MSALRRYYVNAIVVVDAASSQDAVNRVAACNLLHHDSDPIVGVDRATESGAPVEMNDWESPTRMEALALRLAHLGVLS